jgi:hypothetical protein
MKIKKTLFITILLMTFALFIKASTHPNSFVILGNITAEQKAFYTKSIEAADMEQFRLQQQTVVLKFKNGFIIELLSAKELVVKGITPNLDINQYPKNYTNASYRPPVFEVLSSGQLTAEVQTNTK